MVKSNNDQKVHLHTRAQTYSSNVNLNVCVLWINIKRCLNANWRRTTIIYTMDNILHTYLQCQITKKKLCPTSFLYTRSIKYVYTCKNVLKIKRFFFFFVFLDVDTSVIVEFILHGSAGASTSNLFATQTIIFPFTICVCVCTWAPHNILEMYTQHCCHSLCCCLHSFLCLLKTCVFYRFGTNEMCSKNGQSLYIQDVISQKVNHRKWQKMA